MTTADGSHPLITQLVQICAEKGVREFVIAPGSRSAPLTIALARHPDIHCRVVYDERSAGYVALGLAQQLRRPVGLVCTSGTAAVNFGPAVVEAFYQEIPLLVLTADRPPEWIDQQDNQAIHQNGLYAPHVRASYTLPMDDGRADTAWHAARLTAEAIDLACGWIPAPVHINVPLREPLYPPRDGTPAVRTTGQTIQMAPAQPTLSEPAWDALVSRWRGFRRKLIVAGMHPFDSCLRQAIAEVGALPDVALFADVTANLHGLDASLPHADVASGTRNEATIEALQPDLVVSFGGQVTSKYLKQLLRARRPQELWHVRAAPVAPDTYQALTHAIPMAPAAFFAELARRTAGQGAPSPAAYGATWRALDQQAASTLAQLLGEAPFGEFRAVRQLLQALPADARLQIGNSMPIRYVNFAGLQPGHLPGPIHANRGTSGIDGTVSTAVGAALADARPTVLIVGDLGFFYDRNGLWQAQLPPNLRIVLLNNHGGGIFDIIDGPNQLPRLEQEAFFLTPQPLTARNTAEDFGLSYFHATTPDGLAAALPALFAAPGPALLEVETDMAINRAVFQAFKQRIAQLSLQTAGAASSP
jgi:2-succinyl-5-enolpyruvyl-6-hydroxy-3-cyclohexene-1-carboxylate synthase